MFRFWSLWIYVGVKGLVWSTYPPVATKYSPHHLLSNPSPPPQFFFSFLFVTQITSECRMVPSEQNSIYFLFHTDWLTAQVYEGWHLLCSALGLGIHTGLPGGTTGQGGRGRGHCSFPICIWDELMLEHSPAIFPSYWPGSPVGWLPYMYFGISKVRKQLK